MLSCKFRFLNGKILTRESWGVEVPQVQACLGEEEPGQELAFLALKVLGVL